MALSSRKMIKKFAPIPVAGFAANQYFRAKSAGRDFGRPQRTAGRIRALPTADRRAERAGGLDLDQARKSARTAAQRPLKLLQIGAKIDARFAAAAAPCAGAGTRFLPRDES